MSGDQFHVRLRYKGHFVWISFKKDLEDAVKQVKKQFNIDENTTIRFKDIDGALIDYDFLIQYLTINENGVILEIEQDEILDYIDVDHGSSNASTVTVDGADQSTPINAVSKDNAEPSSSTSNPNFIEDYDFPKFDLLTLLQTSPLGNSVLNHYNIQKSLDNRRRTRLVDIIIKHIYNYLVKYRLKHHQYNILTSKIISLFPTENSLTYYVPAIKKADNRGKKHIPARGKLIDKCKNILYENQEVNRRSRRECNVNITENGNITEYVAATLVDEEIQLAITWLQLYTEPWTDVYEKWILTYCIRRSDNSPSVSDYLKKWRILEDHRAISLINYDFGQLFPNCDLNLIHEWDSFFEKIYNIAENKTNIIEELYSTAKHAQGSKVVLQLCMLPHLLPPKGRKRTSSGHWKFSTQEAVDSIIIHAKSAADIELLIIRARETAAARNSTVQPYLLVEGPSLTAVDNVYIIIDTIRYHFKEAIVALDICFKIFHAFHAKYPQPSEHIWTLIQNHIYKIKTDEDKVFPYMMTYYKALEN